VEALFVLQRAFKLWVREPAYPGNGAQSLLPLLLPNGQPSDLGTCRRPPMFGNVGENIEVTGWNHMSSYEESEKMDLHLIQSTVFA
jgi:hypothetical protein